MPVFRSRCLLRPTNGCAIVRDSNDRCKLPRCSKSAVMRIRWALDKSRPTRLSLFILPVLVTLIFSSCGSGGGNGGFWTLRHSGTNNTLYGIASSGSQAVAVGSLGTIVSSSNGLSWTVRSSGVIANLYGIVSSGAQFVVVGDFGTILTSDDLVTWTSQTSGTTNLLRSVAWTGSQFVAVGDAGTILTSPDAMSWTTQTSGTSNDLYGVGGSNALIVAVGTGSTILTSPTGAVWTPQTSHIGNTIYGVVWTGVQFLSVGITGGSSPYTNVQTSFDGMTWTGQNPAIGNTMQAAAWSDDAQAFMAVGCCGTYELSPDGITWVVNIEQLLPFAVNLNSVTWFNNRFIAAGALGAIYTSPK